MDKKKISKKRETYLQKLSKLDLSKVPGLEEVKPRDYLLDELNVAKAIFQCLKENNPEGVMEMIAIHLDAINKEEMLKNTSIPKTTLYHAMRQKNPTIKTLAKIVSSYTHL